MLLSLAVLCAGDSIQEGITCFCFVQYLKINGHNAVKRDHRDPVHHSSCIYIWVEWFCKHPSFFLEYFIIHLYFIVYFIFNTT